MKLVFTLALLLPLFAFGQCDSAHIGTLQAIVHGDTVYLKNDTVVRNCGSIYTIEIIRKSNDTLTWVQTDHAGFANCECHFNLSVTIDSLAPGNYVAEVYYNNLLFNDSCFVGYVSFTISTPNSFLTPAIHNSYQSACFQVGIPALETLTNNSIKIYPNPAQDYLTVLTDIEGEKKISISTVDGRKIVEYISDKNENTIDISNLSKNIYIISVKTKENRAYSKFCKY